MNIRTALLISLILHLLLVAFISRTAETNTDIYLQKGVSGISVSLQSVHMRSEQNNKNHIKPVAQSRFSITPHRPGPRTNRQNAAHNQAADSPDLKKFLGVLTQKAAVLARNQGPEYPYMARRFKNEGIVILNIEVLPDGSTGSITVAQSSGHEILDNSAIEAVKKWKFFQSDQVALMTPVCLKRSFVFKMEQ